MQYDWLSNKTDVLCNPRLPVSERLQIHAELSNFELKGHFWLATSGTTDEVKWVALSKEAVLASARAVNEHLCSTEEDIWITALPDFHVGGMGIWARGFLSKARIIDYKTVYDKWDPQSFFDAVCSSEATLTALVPTQVYDLVAHGFQAPESLRAIIVGGGALQESLYQKAVSLGWRLLPSYGLTECSSQVATAELYSSHSDILPKLKVLSHLQLITDENGFLHISGPSLLTGYAIKGSKGFKFLDPKRNGYFQTEDLGLCKDNYVTIQGRSGSFVKISGESVSLTRLERILEEIRLQQGFKADVALVALPDERLGHVIHLATTTSAEEITPLVESFHKQILPYERIRKVHVLESIPRTALNKLCRTELLRLIT